MCYLDVSNLNSPEKHTDKGKSDKILIGECKYSVGIWLLLFYASEICCMYEIFHSKKLRGKIFSLLTKTIQPTEMSPVTSLRPHENASVFSSSKTLRVCLVHAPPCLMRVIVIAFASCFLALAWLPEKEA